MNAKQTAQDAGLKTEEELRIYSNMWKEAEEKAEKYGQWPEFALVELEW